MAVKPFLDFYGKNVLVTGASSGIGRAIAVELSRHGAVPVLVGRNPETLDETAGQLQSKSCHTIVLDLQQTETVFDTIRQHAKTVGRIYGMCHCAGVVETRPLSACSPQGLYRMLDVNLVAGLEIARAVCRRDIMEADGGSLLFISSVYGLAGMPGQVGYSASKGAVTASVRSLAIELARRNIRVNAISPGLVQTDMVDSSFELLTAGQVSDLVESFPLGTGTPEDVARAAVFLLAPQNRWITGTDMIVDGGFTAR